MIYIAYVAYKGEAEDVAQATKHGRAQAEQKEGKAKQRKSPIMETGSILVADILNYTRMHAVYNHKHDICRQIHEQHTK